MEMKQMINKNSIAPQFLQKPYANGGGYLKAV